MYMRSRSRLPRPRKRRSPSIVGRGRGVRLRHVAAVSRDLKTYLRVRGSPSIPCRKEGEGTGAAALRSFYKAVWTRYCFNPLVLNSLTPASLLLICFFIWSSILSRRWDLVRQWRKDLAHGPKEWLSSHNKQVDEYMVQATATKFVLSILPQLEENQFLAYEMK